MKIKDWKIGTRLGGAFALLLVLMAGCVGLSIWSLSLLHERTARIVDDKYPKTVLAYEVLDLVNRNASVMRNMLTPTGREEIGKERRTLLDNGKELAADLDKLDALIKSNAGKALFKAIQEANLSYGASQQAFVALAEGGSQPEASELLRTRVQQDQRRYVEAARALIQHQDSSLIETGIQAEQLYRSTAHIVLGLALAALVLAVAMAWYITRSITRPLRRAVEIARTVASGDLSGVIADGSKDETGLLLHAMRDMRDSLVRIVSTVRAGADTIATASAQIAVGTLDLSSRTEQQASSLQETASSMEQLASAVQHNADNARHGNQLALAATQVASQGGADVLQLAATMEAISAAARNIGEITAVIDGISFQTNILALNAAVEAARAGEQGRGFAVVASEVRALAQRSAGASREIRGLIEDSVAKVAEGGKLASEAGDTMLRVVDSIKQVAGMMTEMSAANQEQSHGIGQVNQAITQMDAVTQQNAALVEQAAAASQSLQHQASNLTRCVSVFKLDGGRQVLIGAA
ncbi:methyl-accepting chemotaxis protein [Duganella sp. SG902]|uniref:methyl-accepting chemotaxis protein n=1 Tax=Duganella sp. SG902 TaxID=2587016 RepID=UPI00159D3B68|nr:methyl-accepting chemotaxis protein [Duganella sp. SG902]NVM77817.1 methyl-accepting chemotaxis protein [Duganella sp. SG902]